MVELRAPGVALPGQRPPLPFFLLLVMGFLLFDAGMRLVQGVGLLSQESVTYSEKRILFENLLVATFYLLLFLQILLRTLAARIWGTVVFLFHLLWLAYRYGFQDPEEWLAMGSAGRFQILARVIFFTAVVVLFNRSPAKEALRA